MPPISRRRRAGRKARFAICHALALESERAARAPVPRGSPDQPRAMLSLFAPAPPVAAPDGAGDPSLPDPLDAAFPIRFPGGNRT
jgi:hypothetical protein